MNNRVRRVFRPPATPFSRVPAKRGGPKSWSAAIHRRFGTIPTGRRQVRRGSKFGAGLPTPPRPDRRSPRVRETFGRRTWLGQETGHNDGSETGHNRGPVTSGKVYRAGPSSPRAGAAGFSAPAVFSAAAFSAAAFCSSAFCSSAFFSAAFFSSSAFLSKGLKSRWS